MTKHTDTTKARAMPPKKRKEIQARVCTLAEVQAETTLSLSSVRRLIASGELPAIRLGRRVLVPREALERLLRTGTTDGR